MFLNSKKFVKLFEKILKIFTKQFGNVRVISEKLLKMWTKFDIDLIKLRILIENLENLDKFLLNLKISKLNFAYYKKNLLYLTYFH